jgi:hypothetical protein
MSDTYRLPASVAKSPTLKRMREDHFRSVQHQTPSFQGLRAFGASVGGFLGGLCVLAVLGLQLWLVIKVIKILWFF